MGFSKISDKELYMNSDTFIAALVRGGKYVLITTNGEIEIPQSVFESLTTGITPINGVYYCFKGAIKRAWQTAFAQGDPVDSHIEFKTGMQLVLDENSSFADVIGEDYVAIQNQYYYKDEIKQVFQAGNKYFAEFKSGYQTEMTEDEFNEIAGGGGASGTPFEEGDTLSKVYFDTSKSTAETTEIITNCINGGEGYIALSCGSTESTPQLMFSHINGSDIGFEGEAFVIAIIDFVGGEITPTYLFSNRAIEELSLAEGWQNVDSDSAYTYTTQSSIVGKDLTTGGQPAGKNDLWNGVWVSSTAFA